MIRNANIKIIFGMSIIIILALFAVFAPIIATHDPNAIDLMNPLLKAGENGHVLGTDKFGRDLFSRLVFGARVSLLVGIISIGISATIGGVLGLITGYIGGLIDSILMRIMDAISSFPVILIAILLMSIIGQGFTNIIFALTIVYIPGFTRTVRTGVLNVKNEDFIDGLRAIGASDRRIISLHIFPHVFPLIIIYGTMSIATAITTEAALSFIGLGVQPPTPSWGSILSEGNTHLVLNPQPAILSGIAIFILVLSINLVGEGLIDNFSNETIKSVIRKSRGKDGEDFRSKQFKSEVS